MQWVNHMIISSGNLCEFHKKHKAAKDISIAAAAVQYQWLYSILSFEFWSYFPNFIFDCILTFWENMLPGIHTNKDLTLGNYWGEIILHWGYWGEIILHNIGVTGERSYYTTLGTLGRGYLPCWCRRQFRHPPTYSGCLYDHGHTPGKCIFPHLYWHKLQWQISF